MTNLHLSNDAPLSPHWTRERIDETIRLFSKAYGRPILEDEAIELLTNARRLADVLVKAEFEKHANNPKSGGEGSAIG